VVTQNQKPSPSQKKARYQNLIERLRADTSFPLQAAAAVQEPKGKAGRKPGTKQTRDTRVAISMAMIGNSNRMRKPARPVIEAIWEGRSMRSIAAEEGVSYQAISQRIQKWGYDYIEIFHMRGRPQAEKDAFIKEIDTGVAQTRYKDDW
jgi:hypothetical protein